MPTRLIAGLGLLLLTPGCYIYGSTFAADLPQPRALPNIFSSNGQVREGGDVLIPVLHLPDAKIMARVSGPRWESNLSAAMARAQPPALVTGAFFAILSVF